MRLLRFGKSYVDCLQTTTDPWTTLIPSLPANILSFLPPSLLHIIVEGLQEYKLPPSGAMEMTWENVYTGPGAWWGLQKWQLLWARPCAPESEWMGPYSRLLRLTSPPRPGNGPLPTPVHGKPIPRGRGSRQPSPFPLSLRYEQLQGAMRGTQSEESINMRQQLRERPPHSRPALAQRRRAEQTGRSCIYRPAHFSTPPRL